MPSIAVIIQHVCSTEVEAILDNGGIAQLPFAKVDHVGIVVRDLDSAIKYYESLGIGPFENLVLKVTERTLRGKSIGYPGIKVKMANVEPIKFELIEPSMDTPSIWQEFLESRGEGLMHIAFHVEDIAQEVDALVSKGLTVLYSARFSDGGGGIYMETNQIGGVLFELTTV